MFEFAKSFLPIGTEIMNERTNITCPNCRKNNTVLFTRLYTPGMSRPNYSLFCYSCGAQSGYFTNEKDAMNAWNTTED